MPEPGRKRQPDILVVPSGLGGGRLVCDPGHGPLWLGVRPAGSLMQRDDVDDSIRTQGPDVRTTSRDPRVAESGSDGPADLVAAVHRVDSLGRHGEHGMFQEEHIRTTR